MKIHNCQDDQYFSQNKITDCVGVWLRIGIVSFGALFVCYACVLCRFRRLKVCVMFTTKYAWLVSLVLQIVFMHMQIGISKNDEKYQYC